MARVNEDWTLIKKYNLGGVRKRLMEMNRYNGHLITEAPGDPNDPNQGGIPGDDMGGGDPMGGPNQGSMPADPMGDPNQGGMPGGPMGDPSQGGMPGGPTGGPSQGGMPGGDMNEPGMPGGPTGDPSQGGMPGDDMNEPGMPDMDEEPEGDDEDSDTDEMEEGDEVIDVDDLTMSQEETEREIGDVNKNMKTLLKIVKQFSQAIADNDRKMEELKAEFERRNPTEDEKVNIRRKHSGPFNDTPDDFWDGRGLSIHDDNMVDPRHDTEYVITLDDANDFNDKDIADSLSKLPNKLEDFLKF